MATKSEMLNRILDQEDKKKYWNNFIKLPKKEIQEAEEIFVECGHGMAVYHLQVCELAQRKERKWKQTK